MNFLERSLRNIINFYFEDDDKTISRVFITSLIILTFLLGIDVFFIGTKKIDDIKLSDSTRIIYEILVEKDKNNKIELKNFDSLSTKEYNKIKTYGKDDKNLSIENRIINSYIAYIEHPDKTENKAVLEKELNLNYSQFKRSIPKTFERFKHKIAVVVYGLYTMLMIINLVIALAFLEIFECSLEPILDVLIITFPSGAVYLLLCASINFKDFDLREPIFIILIILMTLYLFLKLIKLDKKLSKYKIIKEFEKAL